MDRKGKAVAGSTWECVWGHERMPDCAAGGDCFLECLDGKHHTSSI
jgi:hypothetical protein